jgi:hypothetical protein
MTNIIFIPTVIRNLEIYFIYNVTIINPNQFLNPNKTNILVNIFLYGGKLDHLKIDNFETENNYYTKIIFRFYIILFNCAENVSFRKVNPKKLFFYESNLSIKSNSG